MFCNGPSCLLWLYSVPRNSKLLSSFVQTQNVLNLCLVQTIAWGSCPTHNECGDILEFLKELLSVACPITLQFLFANSLALGLPVDSYIQNSEEPAFPQSGYTMWTPEWESKLSLSYSAFLHDKKVSYYLNISYMFLPNCSKRCILRICTLGTSGQKLLIFPVWCSSLKMTGIRDIDTHTRTQLVYSLMIFSVICQGFILWRSFGIYCTQCLSV